MIQLAVLVLVLLGSPAQATYYWAATTGSTTPTCSAIDSSDLSDDPGSYGTIGGAARCATQPGDIVVVKAGTYTNTDNRINTANNGNIDAGEFVSGTSESVRTMIIGHPSGARPVIDHNASFYCTYDGTPYARHWITLRYLEIDNNGSDGCGSGMLVSGQHVTFDDVWLHDTGRSGIVFSSTQNANSSVAAFGRVVNSVIHDVIINGTSGYCVYAQSTDVIIENSECYRSKGWGWHVYGGSNHPHRATIRNTYVHDVLAGTQSFCAGLVAYGTGHKIYSNVIEITTSTCPTATLSLGAITVRASGGTSEIHNNVIIQPRGHGIEVGTGVSTVSNRNNIFWDIRNSAVTNLGSATVTSTHNAAIAAQSVGTAKVTITALTDCLVSTSDFRLKDGTNPCRNAGTSVSTRPSPVGTTDIGVFEQGEIASATVANAFIEVTINVMTPSIQPTTAITGFTIVNGTSTGTPVVTAAVLKAGATNIVQLSISGFTGSGTCTISYTPGNLKDSGYVGPSSDGLSQLVNSASGVSVTGTCTNTTGDPTPPAGGLYSEFLLAEGSGTTATDSSGNANHGTVSTGVTWVTGTGILATGVYIPTAEEAGDSTYRHVASTHGQGVDPTSNSLSYCILVKVDLQYSQKLIGSSGDYSGNRRAYVGFATSGSTKYWGQGVQSSTLLASGPTEFEVTGAATLVCQRFNAATNTANLSVNRTIGTSAAANKTYTSFTLADNIRAGNDGTFTVNSGGATIYAMWVWNNTYVADADIQALYDSIFAEGETVGCYAQKAHRWQRVHVDGNGNPVNIGTAATTNVVAGGAVALEMQVDCTGSAGAPLALRLWVSDIAGNMGPVPQSLGAFGVAMWGADDSPTINDGVSTCCITGALSGNDGVTILDSVATDTIELAENSSKMFRWVIVFGPDTQGELFTFFVRQDNGAALDGVATTTPQVLVIPTQASGGF